MTIIESAVLGVIQGLTEFIPVSSSGHLLLGHEIFGTTGDTLGFDVALHIGTLVALLVYFWSDLLGLAKNIGKKNDEGKLVNLLIIATIPALIIGYFFGDTLEQKVRNPYVVCLTLIIGGLIMLGAEWYLKQEKKTVEPQEMSNKKAGLIGLAQSIALIPGISRSGVTISAGMFAGLKRVGATRFAFLMAVPVTAAAIAGAILNHGLTSIGAGNFIVGVGMSFISGIFAINFMLSFLKKRSLAFFAYYRFVVAGLAFILLISV